MAHCIKSKEECLPFTQATLVEILNIKIELQNLTRWKIMTHYKVYPNQLKRLKRVEKLHSLKSQAIFSEASQMEWCVPSDFPTRISRFSHVNGKYPLTCREPPWQGCALAKPRGTRHPPFALG